MEAGAFMALAADAGSELAGGNMRMGADEVGAVDTPLGPDADVSVSARA